MHTENGETEKPSLIETGQGFSVFFKNRYLYSRYSPKIASTKLWQSAVILPNSLIVCFSPVLGYGLADLLSIAVEKKCRVVCIEADAVLYDFSLQHIEPALLRHPCLNYVFTPTAPHFISFLHAEQNHPNGESYKRCVFFNLSGGVQLHETVYAECKLFADDFIATFWKNRITLVKLGRLFAQNMLRNLSKIPSSFFLKRASVQKPILIFGAGPSADEVIPQIHEYVAHFFVLAVDSALVPLLKQGIRPDAVIALESQLANEKAFIGAVQSGIPLIADITSRPSVLRLTGAPISFLFSRYTEATFLNRIEALAKPIFRLPPLGSVGLAAIETALSLRSNSSVPIFFAGLDFSFIPAKTHCRETPPVRFALNTHSRLENLENPAPAYREGAFTFTGKNGHTAVSSPSLAGYGKLFGARYAGAANVYDIAPSGMDTGCKYVHASEIGNHEKSAHYKKCEQFSAPLAQTEIRQLTQKVTEFFAEEIAALENLKIMLATGSGTPEKIRILLETREYLYIHFPDGHLGIRADVDFLKRIRNELDFFLKDLRRSANQCKVDNS